MELIFYIVYNYHESAASGWQLKWLHRFKTIFAIDK